MSRRPTFFRQIIWIFGFLLILTGLVHANDKYPGKYRLMKEPEINTKGKVVLLEFADFYCPHCHMFENEVGAKLKKEFGDSLEIRTVSYTHLTLPTKA